MTYGLLNISGLDLEASCLLYDAFVEDASNRRAAV
jgi:hypothetical protein